MAIEPPLLWLYAPLWGVRFDSDGTGLVGGSVLASIPYAQEWKDIQSAKVNDERRRAYGDLSMTGSIPLCLTARAERDADEGVHDGMMRIGGVLLDQVRRSILVLRLLRPGWFLDPELAEVVFAVNDTGWHIVRRAGPYRQAFLHSGTAPPLPGYELEIADLTTDRDSPGVIQRWWEALERIHAVEGSAPLEIAFDAFNRSFGLGSTTTDRLAHLFIAFDAVYGGFNERAPGGVPLAGSKGRLYGRLKNALMASGLDAIVAGRESAWMCHADPGEGRWLRNRVAHGESLPGGDEMTEAVLRVQDIVRRSLRSCVRICHFWHQDRDRMAKLYDLAPDTLPIGAFNRFLAS